MSTTNPTTISAIAVTMFTVSDVDAAIAFYTDKLGFELRADVTFGENGEGRWVEVAPAGSVARLALNPPMGPYGPGGGSIGVETPDVDAEYERLKALGCDVGEPMTAPGAPRLFMMQDPDGNHIAVVQSEPAA
jgi:predicted enzyme related to lactoylglutathione lyase